MDDRQARLFVCYIPGLDARRVTAGHTPFLHELRGSSPTVSIATLPNTELLPTLITGVWPHEHGIWQVSLTPEARAARPPQPVDRLPDLFTTTLQCLRQLVDSSYDLAAVPSRRRRRFDLHRFKYTRRERDGGVMARIGGRSTLFGMLPGESRYLFTKRFESLDRLGRELPSGRFALEFLEMYALDLLQHWHMDRPSALDRAYRATDEFVRRLHARCAERGVTLMVLVDHGQEPVVGSVPLQQELRRAGVSELDYSCFVEVALARFWFHTEDARARITERLRGLSHCRLLGWRDLRAFHIAFEDDACGELYLASEPGWIFFPHDFYQPLASLFLGLTDWHQRPRLLQPRHRGNHGYLPEHPSEQGYAILAHPGYHAARPEIELIDFAPSVLRLLGRTPPPDLRGTAAFVAGPRSSPVAASGPAGQDTSRGSTLPA